MSDDVPMEKLEEGYRIMAGIVRTQGEKYLPIFKRLHDEVMQRRAKQELLNVALQVSDTTG